MCCYMPDLGRLPKNICDLQALQPSVWAIKQLLLYYAQHPKQQLEYYLDLHAHANKKVSPHRVVCWDRGTQLSN